jgi:hypothetical protein
MRYASPHWQAGIVSTLELIELGGPRLVVSAERGASQWTDLCASGALAGVVVDRCW